MAQPSSFAELGLLPIHIACLQGDFRSLAQLIITDNDKVDNDNVIEARTAQGETPLMLAALMGEIENVVILRQHGAAIEAVDGFGRSALAYTSDNAINEMRRNSYARHGFTFSQKDGAKYRCIAIAAILSPTSRPLPSFTGVPTGPIYFRKTSTAIEAYQSIGYIRTPDFDPRSKTVGFIRAATDSTPRAWVVSGWSRRTMPSKLLEGYKWTKAALRRVAPAIGFKFDAHIQDQGFKSGTIPLCKQGSYFASHAEVKSAVWYCFSLLAAMKSISQPSMTFLAQHLGDLATADLGDGRRAKIEIDQAPCKSCARFLIALTRVTKIEFEPSYRRTLALVPETIKRRTGLLAHEADLSEPADKDDGSDTDGEWDTDNDDDHLTLADYKGWESGEESETILDGLEDYKTEAFKKKRHTSNRQRNPRNHSSPQTPSISPGGPSEVCTSTSTYNNNHKINTNGLIESSSIVRLGTATVSTPSIVLTPAARSASRPFEEPESPTEMMLSARSSGSQAKRQKVRSDYYIKKCRQAEIRSWREERIRIKREEAPGHADNERPKTPDNNDATICVQKHTPNTDVNINISPMTDLSVVLRSTSMRSVARDHVSPTRVTAPTSAAATEKIRSFAYSSTTPTQLSQTPHSQAYFSPLDNTPQTVIPAWCRLPLDRDSFNINNDEDWSPTPQR